MARDETLQAARPGFSGPLPGLPQLPGLPRDPLPGRGAPLEDRREEHRRALLLDRRGRLAIRRRTGSGRAGRGLGASRGGGRQTPALPDRRGPGVPDPRAAVKDPFGRRGGTGEPYEGPGLFTGQHPLCARRAHRGPSPPRQRAAPEDLASPAGSGQHRRRRRARPRDHGRGRPHRRPGARGGRTGRRASLQRLPEGPAGITGFPDGELPERHVPDPCAHAKAAAPGVPDRARGSREQPEGNRRDHSTRCLHGHHRCLRVGEEHPRRGHPLSGPETPARRCRGTSGPARIDRGGRPGEGRHPRGPAPYRENTAGNPAYVPQGL